MDFNIEALNWDNESRIKRAKIIAKEISKAVKFEKNFSALEFGCGTGLISFNLYDKLSNITLIDTSKGMIDVLNEKIHKNSIRNMTALLVDINKMTPLIGRFDVIYTSMALHHIEDTEITLRNLFNLLNNGGYLCIVELTEDDGAFHKMEKDFNGEKINDEENVKYSLFSMVGRKPLL